MYVSNFLLVLFIQIHLAYSIWKCGKPGDVAVTIRPGTTPSYEQPYSFYCNFTELDKQPEPIVYLRTSFTDKSTEFQITDYACGYSRASAEEVHSLHQALKQQLNWTEIEICNRNRKDDYDVPPPKFKFQVDPPGAFFFAILPTCDWRGYGSTSLVSNPLQYAFPAFENCTPEDFYLPLRAKDDSYYHEDLMPDTPGGGSVDYFPLKNVGFFFKSGTNNFHSLPFQHMQLILTKELYTEPGEYPQPGIHDDDLYLKHIRSGLMKKFESIKGTQTKVDWSKLRFLDHSVSPKPIRQKDIRRLQATSSNARIFAGKSARYFQLAGSCGEYTFYTPYLYYRVYDLDRTSCIGYSGQYTSSRPGVETCDDCDESLRDCGVVDEGEFINDHMEYIP